MLVRRAGSCREQSCLFDVRGIFFEKNEDFFSLLLATNFCWVRVFHGLHKNKSVETIPSRFPVYGRH